MLAASACPPFDVAGGATYVDDTVTLDKLAAMSRTGVVVLAAHGTTFDENKAGTPALDVHEFILTGEVVTPETLKKYELNLKLHSLAPITPYVRSSAPNYAVGRVDTFWVAQATSGYFPMKATLLLKLPQPWSPPILTAHA